MSPDSPTRVPIAPATPDDAPAIAALRAAAGLPHSDIAPHLRHFLVVRDGFAVSGVIGLEVAGTDALLRSLAVSAEKRHRGLGRALVREVTRLARQLGVKRLFLLTTTATAFFEHAGFAITARTEAPPAIAASGQFQGLCPAVAVCLSAAVDKLP